MTKKLFLIAIVFAFTIVACNNEAEEGTVSTNETEQIDETITVDLAALYAEAGEYIDKEVYVTGIVDHICRHGGKKIFLVQDENNIRIHGTERFDEELTGHTVTVKAKLKETRIDAEYLDEWEAEVNEDEGCGADEKLVRKERIQHLRDSIAGLELGYIPNYYMEFVAIKEVGDNSPIEHGHDHDHEHEHDHSHDHNGN